MNGGEGQQPVRRPIKPGAAKAAPDLNKCQASMAGFGEYVDCLTAQPESCLHALPFGDGHLCQHPDRQNIVARTEAGQITKQGKPSRRKPKQ